MLNSGKKPRLNRTKSGAAAARKQALQKEAKERQEAYNKLTTLQKIDRGVARGMGHRERTKLILKAKKEGIVLSDAYREKLNL